MEGQGQHVEPVLTYRFIIDLHVVVECLFVAQMIVVFHVIIGDYVV